MPVALGTRAVQRESSSHTPSPRMQWWLEYKTHGSDAARDMLVTYYMHNLVRHIAGGIRAQLPRAIDIDDLMQQGFLGLREAMQRYELDRGIRFSTYARMRISGSITDYLRCIDHVPRLTRQRSKRVQALIEQQRKASGRTPTPYELQGLLDLPDAECRRHLAVQSLAAHVSFSHMNADRQDDMDDGDEASSGFSDHHQPRPLDLAERRDLHHWFLRGMEPRDQLILTLYFYEGITMREIGTAIGCSESRVSQCLDMILACLRARLQSSGGLYEWSSRSA